MRTSFLRAAALAACLSCLVSPLLLAQDKDGKKPAETPLSWNPYANAKPGDWVTVVHVVTNAKTLVTSRAVKVEGERVALASEQKSAFGTIRSARLESFPTGAITAEELAARFSMRDAQVAVSEEKKTVSGKEFACTKLSCSREQKMGGSAMRTTFELWLSKDVKCSGLVAYASNVKQIADGVASPVMSVTGEVAGYGSAGTLDWGKKPEDVPGIAQELEPTVEEPGKTKLASNPFASAKPGEFVVLAKTLKTGAFNAECAAETLAIASVAGGSARVSTEKTTDMGTLAPLAKTAFPQGELTAEAVLAFVMHACLDTPFDSPGGKTTVSEEKKTFGGKEFACTKIVHVKELRVEEDDPEKGTRHTIVVWLSKDAKGPGIVGYTSETVAFGEGVHVSATDISAELAGFGSGEKAEWGKKAEDVKLTGEEK